MAEEGETIRTEQIAAENRQLRDVIKHLTIDLEQKKRESQIELSLERVRARTMAMRKSDELLDAALLLFQQVQALGVLPFVCGFNIWDEDRKAATAWMAREDGIEPQFKTSSNEDIYVSILEATQRGESLFVREQGGDELATHYRYLISIPEVKAMNEEMAKAGLSWPGFQIMHCAFFSQGYLMFITYEPVPEAYDIFIRFAKVFEQTYTRFLDLQKAEAQVKEAQIEAALEKVRSRSLAMHKSDELKEVVAVLAQQLQVLGVVFDGGAAITLFSENSKDARILVLSPELAFPIQVNLPYDEEAFKNNPIILDVWKAKETGNSIFNRFYSFDEKNKYFDYVFNYNNLEVIAQPVRDFIQQADSYTASFIAEKNSLLGANSWSRQLFSEADFAVLKRIANVFEQAYVRFLDLQKAEAQAREAQIQLALERVRARTMAMYQSSELAEVASLLFEQLTQLGASLWIAGFSLCQKDSQLIENWMSPPGGGMMEPLYIPYTVDEFYQCAYEAWKTGRELYSDYREGSVLQKENEELLAQPFMQKARDYVIEKGISTPTWVQRFAVTYKYGFLMIVTTKPFEETQIFIRFANVFEQTYTRFLDLQKAEAQSREAQIELGLERVRARAMAMQKSDELAELVDSVFKELTKLHFILDRCIITIIDEDSVSAKYWMANPEVDKTPVAYHVPLDENHYMKATFGAWKERKAKWMYDLKGEEKNKTANYLFTKTELRLLPEEVKKGMADTKGLFLSSSFNNFGSLQADTIEPLSEENFEILYRFGKVFDLTYTRFNDLKQAEAQLRESQIQLALERVRARTMAMHQSTELADTSSVLFQQIKDLGFETWSCGFCIWQKDTIVDVWMGADAGGLLPPMMIPYTKEPTHHDIYQASLRGDTVYEKIWEGKALENHYDFLRTIPSVATAIKQLENAGLSLPAKQCYYVGFFKQGYLLLITKEPNAEMYGLTKRFANVFDQTYTRFLDLQKAETLALQAEQDLIKLQLEKKRAEDALTELKAAQKQLIQSEKMASLGELTAGIAHEIQNPLNFVNNFADVSTELVQELEDEQQKTARDPELEADILGDVKQNLQKITHHGQRASAIVHAMLEHSRTSTGQREPTSLNALADEYLRLAYQGLRAKDREFNCELMTDFDAKLGLVDVVPQEIGRVLLNLYNNAFYAVSQRQKTSPVDYQPRVSVRTERNESGVKIRVQDNGIGISEPVKAKIFQPFFTTKPTGQGTGLGLSLSYDIIKAHRGEINVETKEGEGAMFTIILPG